MTKCKKQFVSPSPKHHKASHEPVRCVYPKPCECYICKNAYVPKQYIKNNSCKDEYLYYPEPYYYKEPCYPPETYPCNKTYSSAPYTPNCTNYVYYPDTPPRCCYNSYCYKDCSNYKDCSYYNDCAYYNERCNGTIGCVPKQRLHKIVKHIHYYYH